MVTSRFQRRNLLALLLLPTLLTTATMAADLKNDSIAIARAAQVLFRDRCAECHGGAEPESGLAILDHSYLIENDYAVAGDVESSMIWQKLLDPEEPMPPPKKGKPLSDTEKQVIRAWIEAGAPPFPADERRESVTEEQVLTAIARDLEQVQAIDRPFIRYFSLTNLYSNSFEKRIGLNSKNVDDDELNYVRAGLSILLNSLSWKHEICLPQAIDKAGIVYRIDLRDCGWTPETWLGLLALPGSTYPYGVDFRYHQNKSLAAVANRLYELRYDDHPKTRAIPYMRIDWFLNTACRGDLYYHLLGLPDRVSALETLLRVDSEKDFLTRQVYRAGMLKSGVSQHNRMVERHATDYGAYWKSFDFAGSEGTRNLLKNPLGPSFNNHPFQQFVFEADGGEMIFNLPNGMQAYYLAGNDGTRISIGPTQIVEDKLGASGSVAVENAISCFACHDQGMKTFTDIVRKNHGIDGREGHFIEQIYLPSDKMEKIVQADKQRFQEAVRKAIKPWFPNGGTTEPVSTAAKKYQRELQLEEVATELGQDPVSLLRRIQEDRDMTRIGAGPLAEGREIKRATWERDIFPKIVLELNVGTPVAL